jgi:hypothetical protein
VLQRYADAVCHCKNNKMKNYLYTAFIFVITLLTACTKSSSSTISGKWNVVSDSTIISGGTVFYSIYRGVSGDYFVFTPNNTLYIKEASLYDTMSYKLTADNKMSLAQTGININEIPETGTYVITGNEARIVVTPNLLNPGFTYQRRINLRR